MFHEDELFCLLFNVASLLDLNDTVISPEPHRHYTSMANPALKVKKKLKVSSEGSSWSAAMLLTPHLAHFVKLYSSPYRPLTLPCSSVPIILHKLLLPTASVMSQIHQSLKDACLQNEFLHLLQPAVRWTLWIHDFANPSSSGGLHLGFPEQMYLKTEKSLNFNIVFCLFPPVCQVKLLRACNIIWTVAFISFLVSFPPKLSLEKSVIFKYEEQSSK